MPRTKDKAATPHLRSGRWITEAKRYGIYLRDGMQCVYCQKDISGEIGTNGVALDHVIAKAGNKSTNLLTACKRCNDSKSGGVVDQWKKDPAIMARIKAQLVKDVNEAEGQVLYDQRRGKAPAIAAVSLTAGELATITGLSLPEFMARADSGEFPKSGEGKFDARAVVMMMISRARNEGRKESEISSHREKKEGAEAEMAMIKAAQARNELMLRADNSAIWRDGFIKIIQAIKSASYIQPQQRDKLVKTLREIEVDEPE